MTKEFTEDDIRLTNNSVSTPFTGVGDVEKMVDNMLNDMLNCVSKKEAAKLAIIFASAADKFLARAKENV